MKSNSNLKLAKEIMLKFANITGIEPVNKNPKRYLWTDAFAVCNYLELFKQTGERNYVDLALCLVDQVHHILGRHRDDDHRNGWISGLNEQEGELHPTIGGLRIGKPLNERKPDEIPDKRLEWDQDGQYFHYLTKWMHALNCVGQVTEEPKYIRWAIELAKTAHSKFTYLPTSNGPKSMYWKMSIDLTYPLVSSMGQHDPLDGFVTYNELQTATQSFNKLHNLDLSFEIADMSNICKGINLTTSDPLGIGGLLFDASRIIQLVVTGELDYVDLLEKVLSSSLLGVDYYVNSNSLNLPANYRLAFREFGLSIGLKGVKNCQKWINNNFNLFKQNINLKQLIETLAEYEPLGKSIEEFWIDEKNRKIGTWIEHQEINMVMLATSLNPEQFLKI